MGCCFVFFVVLALDRLVLSCWIFERLFFWLVFFFFRLMVDWFVFDLEVVDAWHRGGRFECCRMPWDCSSSTRRSRSRSVRTRTTTVPRRTTLTSTPPKQSRYFLTICCCCCSCCCYCWRLLSQGGQRRHQRHKYSSRGISFCVGVIVDVVIGRGGGVVCFLSLCVLSLCSI